MEDISLSVSNRERAGSGAAGRIRREGKIPAVLYGVSGTKNLTIDRGSFVKVWRKAGQSSIVTIEDGDGFSAMTLIQDVQRNALTDDFMHVDFLELTKGHAITASIPVHVHGTPVGVSTEGGILDIHLHEVEVKCLPKDLPHQIDVDVTSLNVGDSLHVKDLPVLEGVEYTGEDELTIAGVASPRVEAEAAAEEEIAEPEIIKERAGDSAEASSEEEK
ncbi:MAG: 50S ribosomal protein L25 [Verrucomicrobiota bacterium]